MTWIREITNYSRIERKVTPREIIIRSPKPLVAVIKSFPKSQPLFEFIFGKKLDYVTARACSPEECGGHDTSIDAVNAAKHDSAASCIPKFDDFTDKNCIF